MKPLVPSRFLSRFRNVCRRCDVLPTRWLLLVQVRTQRMALLERVVFEKAFGRGLACIPFDYVERRTFRISTSRFGTGQRAGSNRTPLGLHQVAQKVGGGWPAGAVFESRRMIGYTWAGRARGAIAHRILWLEGLEPGMNRGGRVDTFARYIYIHGTGDEPTLGRPASRGCIHVAAADLIPLFDAVPAGTLVWIQE